jgi:uncharacterized membrane protein
MLEWGQDGIILPHKFLPNFFGGNIVGLTAGYNTYTAQLEDGTLVGWGLNVNGAAEPPSGLRVSRSPATSRMALNPGLNRVEFKVSSPDRDYVRTYSIAVNRLMEGPPTVSALTAVQVLSNTATLSAEVNPKGRSTEMRLQYSTDQSFNLTSFYVDVPAGFLPVTVNRTISGLQPGTTYFCRMRAVNYRGTTYSPVFQFTTDLPQIPTISSLGTQTILKHGISPWLDFTVGPGPYANQLTVTAASDNPTLLPVSGIEFDSAATGAVRRLRLKPVCGLTGTAVVTLTATLSGSTVATTFTVNVLDRPPADAAEITGLGFLPSFGFGETLDSKALEISGDGNVVAGRSTGRTFRWSVSGGMEDLYFNGAGPDTNRITLTGISYDGAVLGGYLDSFLVGMGQDATAFLLNSGSNYYQALPDSFQLNGLSGDGLIAVGHLNDPISHVTPDQPVRWTEANGIENLDKGGSISPVSATNISSDGSTIVGNSGEYYPGFYFGAGTSACYWTNDFFAPSELKVLDPLPGGLHARANAVSADGGVIVGYSDSALQPGVPKAVRWVREGFTNQYIVHELDSSLSSIATVATAVSADGSRIVGTVGGGFFGGGTAFVWDAENGQQVLQTALIHGGANVNAGWSSLDEATGISADGLYIVGTGTTSDFAQEAFRAKLPQIPPTPIIAPIANVTTPVGVLVVVPFTLSDPDSNVDCLAVSCDLSNPTLLPAANVVLGGSGANRTIRLTPAAGQSGMALIVLSVTDGFSTSEQEFVFTVPSPDSLDGWRFQHFGSASSTGGGALTADPDGDGHTNLEEFAFGTNPGGSSQGSIEVINGIITKHGSPIPLATNTPTSVEFSAVFGRLANWQSLGLIYKVRFSADMMTWEESTVTPTVLATDGNLEAVSIPYPSSIISGSQVVKPQFFEVVISIPP